MTARKAVQLSLPQEPVMHHALLFVSFAACLGLPDMVARLSSSSEPAEAPKSDGIADRLRCWFAAL